MTAITRCPIDGSRIRRNHDGDIECSAALVGNHSAAFMARWLREHSPVKAAPEAEQPSKAAPCKRCGKPKTGLSKAGWAYCMACRSSGARKESMPAFAINPQPPVGYYYEGRFTR